LTRKEFLDKLARRAQRGGAVISDALADRLWTYFELLSRWNRKINLTSLDQPDVAIDRLLLEPVVAARYFRTSGQDLLDVGSGGGSPAIPLKLASPEGSLVMVEAKVRKAAFLREAIRTLELKRARVETARYEELLTNPDLHEAVDVVTIRAVRIETRVLLSLQAFLRPGGQLFLFKGPSGADDVGVTPPLRWLATYPLVDSLRSRLVVIAKPPLGKSG
jgi:16S rRNA (guanine527-N7)-methyltransferase